MNWLKALLSDSNRCSSRGSVATVANVFQTLHATLEDSGEPGQRR